MAKLKQSIDYVKSVNTKNLDFIVLIISIFSLIWVIFYKIFFLQIDEIFYKAFEVSEIVYNIISSIIASGIFYYFVVYLDKKRKQKIIDEITLKKLQSIRVGLFIIQQNVFPILGFTFNQRIPELNEFMNKCKGIKLSSQSPQIPNAPIKLNNWYEYFGYFFQSDRINSKALYDHFIYLDIELVKLLDEIQYSPFERALDNFRHSAITDDISGAPGPFWTYLNSLEKIAIYCSKLEKKHPSLKIGSYEQYS